MFFRHRVTLQKREADLETDQPIQKVLRCWYIPARTREGSQTRTHQILSDFPPAFGQVCTSSVTPFESADLFRDRPPFFEGSHDVGKTSLVTRLENQTDLALL